MRARAGFSLAVLLVAAALAAGCVTRVKGSAEARGVAATVDPAYASEGPVPTGTVSLAKSATGWRQYDVVLPARAPAGAPGVLHEPILMRWYRPTADGTRRPAVLVSPILGSDTAFVELFAILFAREGWHTLAVVRPEVTYDPGRPLSQVEDRLKAAVRGQVQALDWLLERPDVDGSRIATFGISAGGIQGAMVAGVDPRYAGHVFGLAGGPLADVFVDTTEKRLRDLVSLGLETEGITREELRARLRQAIRTDPVALARRVPTDRVLLVLARHDRTVPYENGLLLEEALGGPETVVLPFGHYSSVLLIPFVKARVVAFLRERFAAVAARGGPCAPGETGGQAASRIPSPALSRSPP